MFSCRLFPASNSRSSRTRRSLRRAAIPALGLLVLYACETRGPTELPTEPQPSAARSDGQATGVATNSSAHAPWGVAYSHAATTPTAFDDALVAIIPASETSVSNCFPFGGNTNHGFMGFIYRDVPAFHVPAGGELMFDLGARNDVDIRRNIYLAVANKNPGPAVVNDREVESQGIHATEWIQVVSDTQTPSSRGNFVSGDYDLVYTTESSFSFPGGGLIVGFASSPPGSYADWGCEQVLVNTASDDASGHFYSRFLHEPHLSLGVLDESGPGSALWLGGIVIRSSNTPPVADAGGPYTGSAGAPVQFNGSASSDADGDSLTYLWDFGDGSTGTGATPTHTYGENGPHPVTLTVSDSRGASAIDTTSTQIGHTVVLTVTGSPPVAGVVVTAVKATGADGSGEYQVQLTDAAGQATFHLSDAGWLFHARNLGDRGPQDRGFFLARAPLPEGQGLLQTGTTEGVNHVGVFYDPAGANTSATYNPENLERLTANPVVLSGGSSVREIGVDFEAGATVTCDLRNEDGSPLVVPAPENVFLIVPHREGARLPPLPAGIPGSDLPRAMLVSAATIQAGSSTCGLAGVPSSDGYETAPVLETNPIIVNGEEKLFVQAIEVTEAEANSGTTVRTLIVAEPKRARLEYVEDAWDDTRGDGDLGLLSYGWTLENEQVSDVFALAAHVRGESRYALHARYTDPATGREQSIRSTLEWDAAQKEWTVVEQTPRRLPEGVEVRVTGYAEGSGAELEGTAIWRITLPGVDELEFRAIGGERGGFDFAPDGDFRRATKPTESGNTWLVGVSEED